MTTRTAALYSLIKPSSRVAEALLLVAFNALLVLCSYIAINVPFSPVPITGQTFGILVVAMALGRVRGTAVVLAYLAEGAAGLPVFAGGSAGVVKFLGPTGGYLMGFLVAAFVVGYLADRGWDKRYITSVAAMTLGTIIIFAGGLTWLSTLIPASTVLTMGLYPFIPGALIKIALASVILPSVWKFTRPGR
ncbi:MAG: biotin transporter BioY [Candidatus Zixiibacteriota bacterium]|nr:MAG: biotin transporter BioY [candidate division Zixibacteria bacterium]